MGWLIGLTITGPLKMKRAAGMLVGCFLHLMAYAQSFPALHATPLLNEKGWANCFMPPDSGEMFGVFGQQASTHFRVHVINCQQYPYNKRNFHVSGLNWHLQQITSFEGEFVADSLTPLPFEAMVDSALLEYTLHSLTQSLAPVAESSDGGAIKLGTEADTALLLRLLRYERLTEHTPLPLVHIAGHFVAREDTTSPYSGLMRGQWYITGLVAEDGHIEPLPQEYFFHSPVLMTSGTWKSHRNDTTEIPFFWSTMPPVMNAGYEYLPDLRPESLSYGLGGKLITLDLNKAAESPETYAPAAYWWKQRR